MVGNLEEDINHWASIIESDRQLIRVLQAKKPNMSSNTRRAIDEQIESSQQNIEHYQDLIQGAM